MKRCFDLGRGCYAQVSVLMPRIIRSAHQGIATADLVDDEKHGKKANHNGPGRVGDALHPRGSFRIKFVGLNHFGTSRCGNLPKTALKTGQKFGSALDFYPQRLYVNLPQTEVL